jgi:Sirohaem biosynthesis protein central
VPCGWRGRSRGIEDCEPGGGGSQSAGDCAGSDEANPIVGGGEKDRVAAAGISAGGPGGNVSGGGGDFLEGVARGDIPGGAAARSALQYRGRAGAVRFYPAVVQRGALQIAISTSGQSPALAQRLRKELEKQFGPEYEEWMEQLGDSRDEHQAGDSDPEERKQLRHEQASEEAFETFLRKHKKSKRAK